MQIVNYVYFMDIKQIIIDARTESGLTRTDVAKLAGVSPSTVTRIEAGEMEPTVKMVERLLNAIGYKFNAYAGLRNDPSVITAVRAVLDPSFGSKKSLPEIKSWLSRWNKTGDTEGRKFIPVATDIELAEQAARYAPLESRPGSQNLYTFAPWKLMAKTLQGSGMKWAATGTQAASRMGAHFDLRDGGYFYVEDIDAVRKLLGTKKVGDRSLGTVFLPLDETNSKGVVRDEDGFPLANPLQVGIDCISLGRGGGQNKAGYEVVRQWSALKPRETRFDI